MIGKLRALGGPFSTPGFRAQVARVELEISVFSFYGCLPFVRTIATEATSAPRKPEKKRSEQKQLKENPFTGSHAMCLFFRNNNSEAFFQL